MDSAYVNIIEPFLEVDSQSIFDRDGELYINGFKNILDIANVLLIVSFIIVILSQITSVGISNYGIKSFFLK